MSKSLQDQLLALGVADKKKVRQAKHEKRVASRKVTASYSGKFTRNPTESS